MLYFAYGSNLSSARLLHRLPAAESLGVARLQGFSLNFHKRGMDGSAKCNAFAGTGAIYGVLYHINSADQARLDAIEGLDTGYRAAQVEVNLNENMQSALTYLATHIDGRLQPFDWYLEHVLTGAREWRLPHHYITAIESVETIPDPDRGRYRHELSIYR